MSDSQPDILWEATADEKKAAAISQYMAWLESKYRLKFSCYDDLYQWSIKKPEEFWRSMVSFYQLFDFPEEQPVITNRQQDFIGVRWFESVTLNYAEMIFRRATDSHPAILFTDELNPAIRSVSWQELKKQVASLSSYEVHRHTKGRPGCCCTSQHTGSCGCFSRDTIHRCYLE